MKLNVEVPNELIDAIKEDKLVVFAGAGVSKGSPSNLPDFNELCRKIASATPEPYKIEDVPDKFLGKLESVYNIDVHKKACEYTSTANQPNQLHNFIIDIFKDRNIRIITTNYDNLFEKALMDKNINAKIYDNPAFPFGNDFDGLVHIHGNINDPKNSIVTDEDFGRAYISNGQVSRFLVDVFENYHILFIGYSHNDIIVQYLTRALFRNDYYKRYILTDDDKNWEIFNIIPIKYPNKRYDILNELVKQIGEIAKSNYTDWSRIAKEIGSNPKDISNYDLLKYNIKDVAKLKIFLDNASFSDWFEWLYENSYLNFIFNVDSKLKDIDFKILEWVINYFSKDYYIFKKIIANNNNFNKEFVSKMLYYLIYINTDANILKEMSILLFDKIPKHDIYTYYLIDKLFELNYDTIAIELLKKEFEPTFKMKDGFDFKSDTIEYKLCHDFSIDEYNVEIILEKHESKIVDARYDFALYLIQILEKTHSFYEMVGLANDNYDHYSLQYEQLEEESEYSEKCIYKIICKLITNSISNYSPMKSKMVMKRCFNSNSSMLRKIGLISIRETKLYTSNEKMTMLLEEYTTNWFYEKQYIFKYVAAIFDEINEDLQMQFYNRITKNIKTATDLELYEIYNWSVWICNNSKNHNTFFELENKLANEHNFAPREHPELDIYISYCGFSEDKSEFTKEQLKLMKPFEIIELIINYNPNTINGPNRQGFFYVLFDMLCNDYEELVRVIKEFNGSLNLIEDFWNSLFCALSKAKYSSNQLIFILKEINNILFDEYPERILELINSVIKKSSLDEEEVILSLINKIKINKITVKSEELLSLYINSVIGKKIECYFALLEKTRNLSQKYKDIFSALLSSNDDNKNIIIFGIVGRLSNFYYLDKKWCQENIVPYLTHSDNVLFNASWTGCAYLSPNLNEALTIEILDIFIKKTERIKFLSKTARESFIQKYMLIAIHFYSNPLDEFIPKLIHNINADEIDVIYEIIMQEMKNENTKNKLLDSWLIDFFQIRIEYGNDIDFNNLIIISTKYIEVFKTIFDNLKNMNVKDKIKNSALISLLEFEYIEEYSDQIAELIIFILKKKLVINNYFVKEIILKIRDKIKSESISSELNEQCLKNQIF